MKKATICNCPILQYVPVQYRKILDRHVILSTIADWLSARECVIISFIMFCCYKLSFTMFSKFIIIFASEIPEYIRKLFGRISGDLVHARLENSQDILPMGRRA